MAKELSYHASLADEAFPELVYKLYRHRVPSTIRAKRHAIVKEIFLKDGNFIYATSTDRGDSLGDFLKRQRLVDPKALEEADLLRPNTTKRLGVLLVEGGFLSPALLNAAIRQQVEEIAWSLFAWDEGEIDISLTEVTSPNAIQTHIPIPSMILHGIRRAGDPKPLIARLGGRDTVFETDADPELLIDIGIEEKEYALLRMVDGELTLYELCHKGPYSTAENAKVLYAFSVLQLLHKKSDDRRAIKIRLRADGRL